MSETHTHTVLSVYPRITNQYTLLLLLFQKTEEASIIRAVKYLNRFRKKIELAFEKAKRKKTKSFASSQKKKKVNAIHCYASIVMKRSARRDTLSLFCLEFTVRTECEVYSV